MKKKKNEKWGENNSEMGFMETVFKLWVFYGFYGFCGCGGFPKITKST